MTGKTQTRICESCQAETDADAIFCNECGAMQTAKPVSSAELTCPDCRKIVAPTDKFCRSCAFNLQQAASAANGKSILDENLSEIEIAQEFPAGKSHPEINKPIEAFNRLPFQDKPNPFETKPFAGSETPLSAEKKFAPNLIAAALKRYTDGYRVARLLNGFGIMLKAAGLLVGIGIILLGLIVGQSAASFANSASFGMANTAGLMMSSVISSAFVGTIAGGALFIFGILISANGQRLKAELDGAVHSSPFLSDTEKARVMSLPVVGAQPSDLENYGTVGSLEPNIAASLAYGLSFILGVLWLPVPIYFLLTAPKENSFVRLHSLQSLILNSLVFVIGLFGMLSESTAIYYTVWFASLCANLFCIWKAYNNEKFKIPVIGDLAENFSAGAANSHRSSY